MFDPSITAFFEDRKEAWRKKNINASIDELEVEAKRVECEQIFSLENWLPNAAKRAGQMSLSTHPCTFSHPSARKNKNGYATPIISSVSKGTDGFIRSGNVAVETDALGNAAALDVYKFLTLNMADGRTLIDHIQSESELSIEILTISSEEYQTLRNGFLAMVESGAESKSITSSKIKQVYFPIDNGYHQLSMLSNSGIVFELRKRIDSIRFSDEVKNLRDLKRKNEFSEQGFSELYDLTTIGYGGTKPQNISVLNNQNGGKAHLFLSAPPTLNKRDVCFPQHNFFGESLRTYECKEAFAALHKLFLTDYNNKNIREGRDYRLMELVDRIVERMWAVREVAAEQYRVEQSQLKPHQKIWLCDECQQTREEESDWLDKLCAEIANWIIRSYEKTLGKQAYKSGEGERGHIYVIVSESREALR